MMLRWISLVPPGIVPPNDRSHCDRPRALAPHLRAEQVEVEPVGARAPRAPISRHRCTLSLPNSLSSECSGADLPAMNFEKPR